MPLQREQIATITLESTESPETGVVIVNTVTGKAPIGLCVSSKEDCDAEVWMCSEDCLKVIAALQEALRQRTSEPEA